MESTEPRNRLLARAGNLNTDLDSIVLDPGELIARLLLFDQLVLDSVRLTEIPQLVATFGCDGVMALLADGCLKILCDARSVAQIGQTTALESRARTGPLPLGAYSFALVSVAERDEYLRGCYREVDAAGATQTQLDQLKAVIADSMILPPARLGRMAIDQLRSDLERNQPEIRRALALGVAEKLNVPAAQLDVQIRVDRLSNEDFGTETNLEQLGIGLEEAHKLVEGALLAVGGLDLRLEEMRAYCAISGYREGELALFEDKMTFLAQQLLPGAQEQRFQRVVSLAGIPEPAGWLEQGKDLDIDRLLEIRTSAECVEFRAWLRTIDNDSDAEIQQRVDSLRAKVAGIVGGTTGRVARFAITTAAGLVPVIGLAAGPALGAIDEFMVDKLAGKPGPAAFLTQQYPSLFEGR